MNARTGESTKERYATFTVGNIRHLRKSTRSWGVDLEHSSVLYDRPLFHREVPAADVDTPAAIPWNDATGVPYCQRLALRHIELSPRIKPFLARSPACAGQLAVPLGLLRQTS